MNEDDKIWRIVIISLLAIIVIAPTSIYFLNKPIKKIKFTEPTQKSSELTATNSSTNELFFKCEHFYQNENRIDTITVNTNAMKGTWTTNDLDMLTIMSVNMETTILNTTIAMTPDLMLITTPNFINRRASMVDEFSTYAINRETLTYSDSFVTLGKCSIIKKNNKF